MQFLDLAGVKKFKQYIDENFTPIEDHENAEEVTAAALNDLNDRLMDVEDNTGEENVIEAITFNGTPATITNKNAVITETDPIFGASAAAGITSSDINSWNSKGNAKIFYGTCNSDADYITKAVVCSDFTSANLTKGALVFVTFDYTNTVDTEDVKLNVNNTGAIYIREPRGESNSISYLRSKSILQANCTYLFTYDGTYWVLLTGDSDKDTAYSVIGESEAQAGTSNILRAVSASSLKRDIEYRMAQNQADWNEAITTSPSYIKNKPTIPTIPTDIVKYTTQNLTDAEKTQARANIGAGTYSKPSSGIPATDLAAGVVPVALDDSTGTLSSNLPGSNVTGIKQIDGYDGAVYALGSSNSDGNEDFVLATTDQIPTVPVISTNVVSDKASDVKTSSPKSVYSEIHPTVVTTQPSGGFVPNIFYRLGTITGSVTFSLVTPTDNTIENEYHWSFTAGNPAPTITWPSGIEWVGGESPTINASQKYEISVLDNIAGNILEPVSSSGGGTSYTLPIASASGLGGIKVGSGLSIDSTTGVLSATGGGGGGGDISDVTLGGTSVVSNGVAVLPSYPTTLPASDVSAWAKAANKPTYTASEVGALASGTTLDQIADGTTRKLSDYLSLDGGSMNGGASLTAVYNNDNGRFTQLHSDGLNVTYDGSSTVYYMGGIQNGSATLNLPTTSGTLALTSQIPSAVTESTVSGWGFTKNAAPGTLNTNNSTAQTASASEALSGTINLHKIAKTGTYSDLIGTPTIPTKVSDLTNDSGFTSNTGTITGITMNGSSKGTSGVVNLGTVLTEHQDISSKASLSGAAFTGAVTGTSSGNTAQFRNITISTSDPSGGSNGDIWIKISS